MKLSLSLLLCCLSLSPLMAAPFDGIDWDKSRNDILRQLPKSSDFELNSAAKSATDKLTGACTLNEEIAYQKWTMNFHFNKKGTALENIVLIGAEGFDSELWDNQVLKSYYLFVTNALKDKYGLGDRSVNTPHYDPLSKVIQSGEFYPMHSYKTDGLIVTVGMHYNKKTKQIHAAFMLEKGAADSALGESGSSNPNVLGDPSEWANITNWESQKDAEEFLTRVGLIKPKPAPAPVADGGDGGDGGATIIFTIGDDNTSADDTPAHDEEVTIADGEGFGGDTTPSDADTTPDTTPAAAPMAEALAMIDTSLPADEQALLKAFIAIDADQANDETVQTLNNAARKGNARALYQLALSTDTGKGLTQDSAKAEKLYLAAAQAGYALALVRFDGEHEAALASIGFGPEEAQGIIATIQEEAQGSSVSARLNLAVMYRYGFGVRKDVSKARAMLEQLKSQGDIDAAKLLEKLF